MLNPGSTHHVLAHTIAKINYSESFVRLLSQASLVCFVTGLSVAHLFVSEVIVDFIIITIVLRLNTTLMTR